MDEPKEPKGFRVGPTKRALIASGVVGLCVLLSLLYAVLWGVPNFSARFGSQSVDFKQFATGPLAKLEIMPKAPSLPDAAITGPDGQPARLTDKAGRVILVNLWATWCAPCVVEMPTLAALHRSFEGRGFEVVAVSVDRADTAKKAEVELARLSGGALRFYHDPRMAVVFPMKARGFPTSVLYDGNGKEIARLAGEADWNSPEARALIEAALAQASK
jgi:thiol-disulfide isomerase/thioredoxin